MKTSRSFNLFRDRRHASSPPSSSAASSRPDTPTTPVPAAAASAATTSADVSSSSRSVSDDFGYLSDYESGGVGIGAVKSRFKEFLFDSFGKGARRKPAAPSVARVRPVIGGPIAAVPLSSFLSVDSKVSRSVDDLNCDFDPSMFEGGADAGDGDAGDVGNGGNNRASIVSGTSTASSGGTDTTSTNSSNVRLDANGNDVEEDEEPMSPEEKQARKVYNIAREMMTSEQDFVNVLRLVNVDFREFICAAIARSKEVVIPEEEFSRLFSNLLELQILNSDLLKDFQARLENWESEKKIADVIVKKGPFLKLYTSYVQDFNDVSSMYFEYLNKYEVFARLVHEFERQEKCRNLKVEHFMLKPVQRLPQYKLLLENYLKNLSPDSPDYSNAMEALDIVTKAAEHANEKMKQTVRKKLFTFRVLFFFSQT